MTYKVRELYNGRYGVYAFNGNGETLVKTCKTKVAAEKWVKAKA